MNIAILIAVLLFGGSAAVAGGNETVAEQGHQEKSELLRVVLHADRKAIVEQNIKLESSEQDAFWPEYHAYRVATNRVKDKLQTLLSRYAELYGTHALTDKHASKLLADFLSFQQELIRVKKSYAKRFKKVIPAKKVARFYQIDQRLDTMEMLEIAQSTPLL